MWILLAILAALALIPLAIAGIRRLWQIRLSIVAALFGRRISGA